MELRKRTKKMRVAFVYSSKAGMAAALDFRKKEETKEEEDEPPPDLLAECDSDETIEAVSAALCREYEVIAVESDQNSFERLKRAQTDLVFNIAERLLGPNRESHIPLLCEILDIPYTGSDPLTLGICLDKSRAKEILTYHGIPTPEFWVVESAQDVPEGVIFPAIVKPCYEGSSKGIFNHSVVEDRKQLVDCVGKVISAYKQPALIERFLAGREFTVGVLGNHPRREVLPIIEIDYSDLPSGAAPIYSYEAKWIWDRPEDPLQIFRCPADISDALRQRIEQLVLQTCRVLRVLDWGRIDVRLDENGEPHVLEVNPLPGILPNMEDNSCLPKAARAAGYSYTDLILRVVDEALARYGMVR